MSAADTAASAAMCGAEAAYPNSSVFSAALAERGRGSETDAVAPMLRRWFSSPFDYWWVRAHSRSRGRLTVERQLASAMCFLLSIVGVAVLFFSWQKHNSMWCFPVIVFFATGCAAYAISWLRPKWPSERRSQVFLAFADMSVCVYIVNAPGAAAAGLAALFVVPGMYAVFIHGPRTLLAHLMLATAVTTITVGDISSPVAVEWVFSALVYIASAVGTITTFVLAHIALSQLRHDAWMSFIDPLTGALNRRGLFEAISRISMTVQPAVPLVVMLVDLDKFKAVNDKYGHDAGDQLLIRVVDMMNCECEKPLLIARVGGEEFAIAGLIAPGEAWSTGERIRNRIRAIPSPAGATASIGIAEHRCARSDTTVSLESFRDTLSCADSAMYSAKNAGGDRTYFWTAAPPSS